MNPFYNLIIEPLKTSHNRKVFKCGVSALDNYLKKQAGQDIRRNISRVFAAVPLEKPETVIGYYTLSSLSIELEELPDNVLRKLPKHPVPAALIGRLAVDKSAQGNGIGKMLLADAVKRIAAISNEIAIYALVVDVINDEASCFYQQFGFQSFTKETRRLFLPLRTIN